MRKPEQLRKRARDLAKSGMAVSEIAYRLCIGYDCVARWTDDLRQFRPINPAQQSGLRQGHGPFAADHEEPYRECSEPTNAPLGSKERIAIYRARTERGESLYHEQDNTLPKEPMDCHLPISSSIRTISHNPASRGKRLAD